jgi:hypothetical protein
MKCRPCLAACLAAVVLPLVAEPALEPVDGQGELLRAWTIEDLYKASSADQRVSVTIVAATVGHMHNANRLVATIWDDAPVEGDSSHSTTFDLGRVNRIEPPVRLERRNDRLYRLSYDASVSDTFDNATLRFTCDLHLAADGGLKQVVPVLEYSSFWDMDGSTMGMVASGRRRSIYFVEPGPDSTATPGMLFFHGTTEGKTYRGKVLNWLPREDGERRRASIDGSALVAEGEVQDEGRTIVLKSQATEWKNGENVPVGPKKTQVLRFDSVAAPDR